MKLWCRLSSTLKRLKNGVYKPFVSRLSAIIEYLTINQTPDTYFINISIVQCTRHILLYICANSFVWNLWQILNLKSRKKPQGIRLVLNAIWYLCCNCVFVLVCMCVHTSHIILLCQLWFFINYCSNVFYSITNLPAVM